MSGTRSRERASAGRDSSPTEAVDSGGPIAGVNQALGLLLLVAGLLLAVLEHAGATAIPVSFAVLIGGMGLVSLTLGVVAEAAGREQRRVTTDDDQQRLTAVHRASRTEAVTSTDVHGTSPSAAA